MPEDVMQIEGISDVLINGQEAKPLNGNQKGSTKERLVMSRYLPPVPGPFKAVPTSSAQRQPQQKQTTLRDRAYSIDNHELQTLGHSNVASSSRPLSSASSSSPLAMNTNTTPHSQTKIIPQADRPCSSKSINSSSLLYNLLISTDSQSPLRRPKQPLTSSVSNTDSPPYAKKTKLDEILTRNMPLELGTVRRFSFSGDAAHAEELRAYNRNALVSLHYKTTLDKNLEEEVAMGVLRESTDVPSTSTEQPPVASAPSPGVSSTSTDSGLDEPLDLTPGKIPHEPIQLAKKTTGPAQARISEWLRSAAEYVYSCKPLPIPWLEVLKHTWHRLVVLSMAEYTLDVVLVKSQNAADHIQTGDKILPWLSVPSDVDQLIPTRYFGDQLTSILNDIRKQKLTRDEFQILRHAVLLTAAQPSKLSEVGLKTLQATRMIKEGIVNINPGLAGVILYPVTCALIGLETLSSAQFAGLFCGHLRGQSSMEIILTGEMRSSLRSCPSPGDSILGRLISETSCAGPSNAPYPPPRPMPSGITYIPPERRK